VSPPFESEICDSLQTDYGHLLAAEEMMMMMIRVYFRPLKKGVVLPLATVKRGRATP